MSYHYERTGQPAVEPVTLAEAKAHLRVDGADLDGSIAAWIIAARMDAESRLGRTLVNTPWRLTRSAFGCGPVGLPMSPVSQVASVVYIDTAGTAQALASSAWVRQRSLGVDYLVPTPGSSWPAVQRGNLQAVTVDYVAGFGAAEADVPAPVRQWILLAVGDMCANTERSSDKVMIPQGFADGLLDPYKVWGM